MARAVWTDLKRLRALGKRPRLPVIVTDNGRDVFGAFSGPFLVVVHEPRTPFPVDVTHGLDVILLLDCAKASALIRLFNSRDSFPASCLSWCQCERMLTACPHRSCEQRDPWPDA